MKLYIYEHCPFCVRPRMMIAWKKLNVEQVILSNDDEDTPISMIGAKQVPILEKDDGSFMGESLDIVHYLDGLSEINQLKENIRPEIQDWLDKVGKYHNKLVQPRMIKIGLPEFATASAIEYFVTKKEKNIGNFDINLSKTAQYLIQLNEDLLALEALISEESLDGNGCNVLKMEDILLFPVLRNLTIVKEVEWPPKIMDYVLHMSKQSDVALYLDRAL